MLENVQMIYECYAKMLTFYKPENIEFLGFSSGGALILDLITYINELNDSGSSIQMPGLLIPVSPGSVPVTEAEKAAGFTSVRYDHHPSCKHLVQKITAIGTKQDKSLLRDVCGVSAG